MSDVRQIVRKLRAFQGSRAQPKYSTILTHLPKAPAFLAFVRMSGETRPWGVAFGTEETGPKVYSAMDGRDREQIQSVLEDLSIDLINYFCVENFTFDPITKESLHAENPPQIWVPNSSHIDMLHFINYMYWKPRTDDAMDTYRTTLSRLCGWLFRESKLKGQQLVVDSAAVLRENYVFPVDDVTISNPAVALEWMKEKASIREQLDTTRDYAEDAAGTTLQPDVEKVLEKLLKDKVKNEFEIGLVITAELERRWSLALDTFKTLQSDSRESNPGAFILLQESLKRFVDGFQYTERKKAENPGEPSFTPHPETDNHGSAAAASYFDLQSADSKYLPALIHNDEELLKDSIFSGHAISGNVVRVYSEQSGVRTKEIYWVFRVEARDDFRIREGERLAPMGNPGHSVKVVSVEFFDETQIDLVLHWKNRKTKELTSGPGLVPVDNAWESEKIYFVPVDSSEFSKQSRMKVWKAREGIGSWLTHGSGTLFADASVIDDVKQIEGE